MARRKQLLQAVTATTVELEAMARGINAMMAAGSTEADVAQRQALVADFAGFEQQSQRAYGVLLLSAQEVSPKLATRLASARGRAIAAVQRALAWATAAHARA